MHKNLYARQYYMLRNTLNGMSPCPLNIALRQNNEIM
jgi:hypothetical protein